jgi:Holliday junction resolvase
MTSTAPPLTEADFQRQIVELARIYGWEDFHVRAGRTRDSWRVPGSGSMAAGWPDLVLVKHGRIIFMEVKRAGGKATSDQQRVIGVLSAVAEAYIVQPKDWDFIQRELAA